MDTLSKYFPFGVSCREEKMFVALMEGLHVRFYLVVRNVNKNRNEANLSIMPQLEHDANSETLQIFLTAYTSLLSI